MLPIVRLMLTLALSLLAYNSQAFTTPPYTVPYYSGGTTYTWITQAQADSNNSYVFYCKETASEPTIDFNSSTTFFLRFGGGYGWYESNYCILFYTSNNGSSWGSVPINGYYYMGHPDHTSFTQFRSHRNIKYNRAPSNGYTNANFGVSNISQGDTLIAGSSFSNGPLLPFSFVINGYTPYNAPVTAVMDQDSLGTATPYAENNIVNAYIGSSGNIGPYGGSTCYRKSDNSAFLTGYLTYIGVSSAGGNTYLCYDGHPGYDYGFTQGTNILAPEGGIICAIHSTTNQQTPPNVWRNTAYCPLANIPAGTSANINWTNYHAFYILHGSKSINGSTNEYMTVVLHSDELEGSVLSSIHQNGYANISRYQPVATIGGWGPSGANTYSAHLHIEFYKKVDGVWNRIDPHGSGLW